jgi:hypothetical protein
MLIVEESSADEARVIRAISVGVFNARSAKRTAATRESKTASDLFVQLVRCSAARNGPMCLAIHTTNISQFAATFNDARNREIHRSYRAVGDFTLSFTPFGACMYSVN